MNDKSNVPFLCHKSHHNSHHSHHMQVLLAGTFSPGSAWRSVPWGVGTLPLARGAAAAGRRQRVFEAGSIFAEGTRRLPLLEHFHNLPSRAVSSISQNEYYRSKFGLAALNDSLTDTVLKTSTNKVSIGLNSEDNFLCVYFQLYTISL